MLAKMLAVTSFCKQFGNQLEVLSNGIGVKYIFSIFLLKSWKMHKCITIQEIFIFAKMKSSKYRLADFKIAYKMTSQPSILACGTDKKNQNIYY